MCPEVRKSESPEVRKLVWGNFESSVMQKSVKSLQSGQICDSKISGSILYNPLIHST